jgi:dTDP-4-dehydrorhamnose reductase
MLNVLVTGGNGQLGSEIKELSVEYKYNFLFTDRDSLDISNEKDVKNFIETNDINIIINCAAYTAVDKAEDDEANADKINHIAVKYLAEISKEKNIRLIHLSTDYVFNGEAHKPYVESDTTNPNSVYGRTKLDGEKVMQDVNPGNSIIIRTSWVYSSFGNNFVKTMLRLGNDKDTLGVIFDQVGTPTYARDLASAILEIIPQIDNDSVEIYNYSNEGVSSWYDFSKAICDLSQIGCCFNPIETKEYPTPATRPHYSLLNKAKIKDEFGITIPHWRDSLINALQQMEQ